MTDFSIKYHDGKSSAAHEAMLTLMPDHWLIFYIDPLLGGQTIRWELQKITAGAHFETLFIFRYDDFLQQVLESKDERLLIKIQEKYPAFPFAKKRTNGFLGKGIGFAVTIVILIIGLLGLLWWYGLPFIAEKIATRIPQNTEVKLGEQMYKSIISDYKINDSLTRAANDFARSIDFKTTYPIKITVVKENQSNAFALPGGNIVVFDGILKGMKTKEELAALLAHEVSHIHYRHSLKTIFRGLGNYLFISLIFNDLSGIAAVIAENSNMLTNLTYSRELETESDQKAIEVLKSDGISLKGFVDLFKLLKSESGTPETYKMLSSHPLTDDRIQYAKAQVREQTNFRNHPELQEKWLKLRQD